LLNLAECLSKQGRTASAWLRFNEAAGWAARNKEVKRESFARKRAAALKPRLQYAVVKADSFPPNAKLVVDEEPEVELNANLSLPVDPGRHRFAVTASGYEAQEVEMSFEAPGSSRVWNLAFVPVSKVQADPVASHSPPPLLSVEAPGVSRRTKGVVVASGATLIGLGAAGLTYCFVRHDAFKRQQVGGPDEANPTVSRAEFERMRTLYPVSWVVTAAGSAVLASGLYALFSERPLNATPGVSVDADRQGAGVFVQGAF
jgi:hypothetical protein